MNRPNSFKLALLQLPLSEQKDKLAKHLTHSIESAARLGAQVICLPELCHSHYFCILADFRSFDYAISKEDSFFSTFKELAKKTDTVIVVPFFEKADSGIYYNSACIINTDGETLGYYRKMHIPDDPNFYEKFYFIPGESAGQNSGQSDGYPVFETKYGRIGVLICYDQWFPEAARLIALKGADVILYPTAIGWLPDEKDQFGFAQVDAWKTIQRSHAIANGVYVASVNRIGIEKHQESNSVIEFFGHSFICGPFGEIIEEAPSDKASILIADISREKIEETRRMWPFFRDRRIDSYMGLQKRFLTNN